MYSWIALSNRKANNRIQQMANVGGADAANFVAPLLMQGVMPSKSILKEEYL